MSKSSVSPPLIKGLEKICLLWKELAKIQVLKSLRKVLSGNGLWSFSTISEDFSFPRAGVTNTH